MQSTPADRSAANIRRRMERFGKAVSTDEAISEAVRSVHGSSLSKTVHQNFTAGTKWLRKQLNQDGNSHLSEEVLQSAIRGLASLAIWDRLKDLRDVLAKCESPAEELFLIALDTVLTVRSIPFVYTLSSDPPMDQMTLEDLASEFDQARHIVEVKPQGEIDRPDEKPSWDSVPYRADFLVTCVRRTDDRRLPIRQTVTAIEIDGRGHATDASRNRDNERDRVFREQAIITDRYTGVDILKDPFGCAERAVSHFLSL